MTNSTNNNAWPCCTDRGIWAIHKIDTISSQCVTIKMRRENKSRPKRIDKYNTLVSNQPANSTAAAQLNSYCRSKFERPPPSRNLRNSKSLQHQTPEQITASTSALCTDTGRKHSHSPANCIFMPNSEWRNDVNWPENMDYIRSA